MAIDEIIGAEMYSVTFVRDYVQIGFHCDKNDAFLTAYALPSVTLNGVKHISENVVGYRDALCRLINQKVRDVDNLDDDLIKVIFEGNDVLSIGPTQTERETLVEFAVFICGDICTVST